MSNYDKIFAVYCGVLLLIVVFLFARGLIREGVQDEFAQCYKTLVRARAEKAAQLKEKEGKETPDATA